jgi:peptidoglycan/xylan/chitin deacetylase (PgdA/CDA1 family)
MLSWIIRCVANRWSCTKGGAKLNILTYHRVNEFHDEKHPETISLTLFTQQIKWLKKHFVVLPLPEALALQASNTLPLRAVCITIDDGYRDSYEFIYKTLKEEGVSGTFFVSTQGITNGGLWDADIYSAISNAPENISVFEFGGKTFDLSSFSQRVISRYKLTEYTKYLPLIERKRVLDELKKQTFCVKTEPYFLTANQIKSMHDSGMTIAAHTHHHPILLKENDEVALNEIKKSKDILENIIEAPVEYFAYPNGKYGKDYNEKHMRMAEELGFKAALSTDWGSLTNLTNDRFKVKRFTPWDEKEFYFCLRLALNYRR